MQHTEAQAHIMLMGISAQIGLLDELERSACLFRAFMLAIPFCFSTRNKIFGHDSKPGSMEVGSGLSAPTALVACANMASTSKSIFFFPFFFFSAG